MPVNTYRPRNKTKEDESIDIALRRASIGRPVDSCIIQSLGRLLQFSRVQFVLVGHYKASVQIMRQITRA
jgi:hypothetical protein